MASSPVPETDGWTRQVQEAFGFLEELGFRVVDSGTYMLGNWTLFGDGYAGVYIDSDFDCRFVAVKLIRLDDNRMPERWWERRDPRVSLSLYEVAELLAPQSLSGGSGLPRIEREADRAPHLQFWASVLQVVARDWLQGHRTWFAEVELQTTRGLSNLVRASTTRERFPSRWSWRRLLLTQG
jgi:hypothetical protein